MNFFNVSDSFPSLSSTIVTDDGDVIRALKFSAAIRPISFV
jgi:hypothetical protein